MECVGWHSQMIPGSLLPVRKLGVFVGIENPQALRTLPVGGRSSMAQRGHTTSETNSQTPHSPVWEKVAEGVGV